MARFVLDAAAMLVFDPVLSVQNALEKFLGPEIRAEDGKLPEVTVLFADLRDFTGWVGSTSPRDVARDLSVYFTEMESAIRRHRGLVVQFIGDEIEAVFGAPTQCAQHADMAVAAALEMRQRLQVLNLRRTRDGSRPLRHGIGIHTGTVLGSVIGTATRVAYALIGDTVNVASRLQELNKRVGSDILVSGTTRARVQRRVDFAEIDPMRLNGRTDSIAVYQVR